MQIMTTEEIREELALHFGPDAVEAVLDTAQECGQVTTYCTDGHEVTVLADDDAQEWGFASRDREPQTFEEHTAAAVAKILGA